MEVDFIKINQLQLHFLAEFESNRKFSILHIKRDRVNLVYNTAALEGNAMTFPEVQTILDGITVGGHKLSDEEQILNQNKSITALISLLEKREFRVDLTTILFLHNLVATNEALEWGSFRKSGVTIGGTDYTPPAAEGLYQLFEKNINSFRFIGNSIVRALTVFLIFAKNQFFFDGNKRTARLMMNGVLIQTGFPILNIKAKDKLWFNNLMIAWYNSDNIIPALESLAHYYYFENEKYIVKS